MASARSSASLAAGAVFAHCRRITSAPTWITTCQCFFSGFHSTVAVPVCVIVLLQPQITGEIRQREGSEKHLRRIDGHANLWSLAAILGRQTKATTQPSK